LVGPSIQKLDTNYRKAITASERLSITIRWVFFKTKIESYFQCFLICIMKHLTQSIFKINLYKS
jgi:hypothetical protein